MGVISLLVTGNDYLTEVENIIARFGPERALPSSHPALRTLCGIFDMVWRQREIDRDLLNEKIYHLFLSLAKPPVGTSDCGPQARFQYILDFLHWHYAESITLADIALIGEMRRSALYSLFQQQVQTTPMAYLTKFRLEKSCEFLRDTTWPVVEIARRCGFEDARYFSRVFGKHFGQTPTEYRKYCMS